MGLAWASGEARLRPNQPSWWSATHPIAGEQAENRGFGMTPMPATAGSLLLFAFCCFLPACPAFAWGAGKQKRPRRAALNRLKSLRDFGAGEGIRTLDPNLGKVVPNDRPGLRDLRE
jgi:hypothetical protein